MKEIPLSEIDTLFQALKDIKRRMEIEKNEDSIKLKKGATRFEAKRSGEVSASMPLHTFETENAKYVEVGDKKIKVKFETGSYELKIQSSPPVFS